MRGTLAPQQTASSWPTIAWPDGATSPPTRSNAEMIATTSTETDRLVRKIAVHVRAGRYLLARQILDEAAREAAAAGVRTAGSGGRRNLLSRHPITRRSATGNWTGSRMPS